MPEGQTVMDKNKQGKRAARKLGGQRLDATSSLASFGFAFASVLFPLWLLGFQTHATSDPKEGASGYSRVGRDVIDSAGCQWVGQMLPRPCGSVPRCFRGLCAPTVGVSFSQRIM